MPDIFSKKVLARILKVTGSIAPRTRVHKEGAATDIADQPIKVGTLAGRERALRDA